MMQEPRPSTQIAPRPAALDRAASSAVALFRSRYSPLVVTGAAALTVIVAPALLVAALLGLVGYLVTWGVAEYRHQKVSQIAPGIPSRMTPLGTPIAATAPADAEADIWTFEPAPDTDEARVIASLLPDDGAALFQTHRPVANPRKALVVAVDLLCNYGYEVLDAGLAQPRGIPFTIGMVLLPLGTDVRPRLGPLQRLEDEDGGESDAGTWVFFVLAVRRTTGRLVRPAAPAVQLAARSATTDPSSSSAGASALEDAAGAGKAPTDRRPEDAPGGAAHPAPPAVGPGADGTVVMIAPNPDEVLQEAAVPRTPPPDAILPALESFPYILPTWPENAKVPFLYAGVGENGKVIPFPLTALQIVGSTGVGKTMLYLHLLRQLHQLGVWVEWYSTKYFPNDDGLIVRGMIDQCVNARMQPSGLEPTGIGIVSRMIAHAYELDRRLNLAQSQNKAGTDFPLRVVWIDEWGVTFDQIGNLVIPNARNPDRPIPAWPVVLQCARKILGQGRQPRIMLGCGSQDSNVGTSGFPLPLLAQFGTIFLHTDVDEQSVKNLTQGKRQLITAFQEIQKRHAGW
ncbi:MAG TPA: hypothetical protein VF897_06030, partial [Roseiflexaceae bacterium]